MADVQGSGARGERSVSNHDWRRVLSAAGRVFLNDVFRRPCVGAFAGWLIGALIALVVWLTIEYAGQSLEGEPGVISLTAAYWTVGLMALLALAVGWEPILMRRYGSVGASALRNWITRQQRLLRLPLNAIGWVVWLIYRTPGTILSFVDLLLARPIAIAAGTTLRPTSVRYGALFVWMLATGLAAYLLPAPWGLFAAAAGILIVLSIARRWNWVERDREAFLAARQSISGVERIGFREDLRDEALTALVFLFVLIPLALRQVDLAYDAFDLFDGNGTAITVQPSVWAWIGFFGGELAKSIPFVDWSEVYEVANDSPIEAKTPFGKGLVFGLRASLDLLLLAAVLQAVQIAARLRDQRAAFEQGQLKIVDPFAERAWFGVVGASEFDHPHMDIVQRPAVRRFPDYEADRLCAIASGHTANARDEAPVMRDAVARRGAMAVLARQHPDRLIGALSPVIASEPDTDLRAFAIRLAAETDAAGASEPLMWLLQDKSAPTRLREDAARQLGRYRVGRVDRGVFDAGVFDTGRQLRRDRIGTADVLVARLTDGSEHLGVRAHAGLAAVKLQAQAGSAHLKEPDWRSEPVARALFDLVTALNAHFAKQSKPRSQIDGVFTTAYALGLYAGGQGAEAPADEMVEAFAEPLREMVRRAVRSALGELDQMVRIPAGNFVTGSPDGQTPIIGLDGKPKADAPAPAEEGRFDSEGPQHEVAIPRDFEIGRYAVTFEEYLAFCAATGREEPSDSGWGKGKQPVINVSWDDAQAYCDWLNRVTGERYRLPSEAEWEYAARAGTTGPFSFEGPITTDKANYDGNFSYAGSPEGEYRARTVQVDSFQPNPWGLYQVHGNVWEWCADPWHEDYQGAPADGSIWVDGGVPYLRVLRGGSWFNYPLFLRSAFRYGNFRVIRGDSYGFRLARTLTP